MRLSYALIVLLTVSACKRVESGGSNAVPVQEVVAGVPLIDFNATEAGFSCRAPSDWGVPEKNFKMPGGTLFIGPTDPVKKTSARIAIHKFPESEPTYNDAQKYAETFWMLDQQNKGQPPIEKKQVGDQTVLTFHQERKFYKVHGSPNIDYWVRYDYALFPVKGGFFEIVHQAPTDSYDKTLPVFEAVVKSFKPKS